MYTIFRGTNSCIKTTLNNLPTTTDGYHYKYEIKINKLFGETLLSLNNDDMNFEDDVVKINIKTEHTLGLLTGFYIHELRIIGEKTDIVFQEELELKPELTDSELN